MTQTEKWESLWAEFYATKAQLDRINAELVACKAVLRSQGIAPVQPPAEVLEEV